MTEMSVLDKTLCVRLRVSRWAGRATLRARDLGDAAKTLPPEDLATLGSLRLCDPRRLKKINAIKYAAEAECERICVAFLGGFATDQTNLARLIKRLTELQDRFCTEVNTLAENLQTAITEWTDLHPQWKPIIEQRAPNRDYVLKRFKFEFQFYRVTAAGGDAEVTAGLTSAVNGLPDQLFKEIEALAAAAWKQSFEGRLSVGQKALRPLKKILSKLEALRYLDSRCDPIIDQYTRVLGSIPQTGAIEDPHLSALIGLFRIVENSQTARAHGAALLRGPSLTLDATLVDSPDLEPFDETVTYPTVVVDEVVESLRNEPPRHLPTPAAADAGQALWF